MQIQFAPIGPVGGAAQSAIAVLVFEGPVLSAAAQALPRASRTCDLAFLDPPYEKGLATPILASLAAQGWLRPGAVVSVETGADEIFDLPQGYVLRDRREAGRRRKGAGVATLAGVRFARRRAVVMQAQRRY